MLRFEMRIRLLIVRGRKSRPYFAFFNREKITAEMMSESFFFVLDLITASDIRVLRRGSSAVWKTRGPVK